MITILNKQGVAKFNAENNRSRTIKVYNTHGKKAMFSPNAQHEIREHRKTVSKKNFVFVGSAEHAEILNKIEDKIKLCRANGITDLASLKRNISHYPSGAEDLFDLIRLDITARILDEQDITPFIAEVVQRDDFTDPTNGQILYEYCAPFGEIEGTGDRVNLVQIKTGEKDSIYFTIYGVGFEQDLYNQLFNNIFDMQKVTKAVSKGYVLRKNNLVMGPIIGFNWPPEKVINPETAYTYEQNIYDTIQLAIDTLGNLQDYQTKEFIDIMGGLTLICHSTKVRALNRALNGELRNGSEVKNLSAVREITRIIPFNTKYQYYGNKRLEYPGCEKDVAYLCVPRMYNWLALKRDLTHITGPGDTFGITSEREAWYFVASVYNNYFLGGDKDDPQTSEDPTVLTREHGYIVKIDLPEQIEPET